MGWRQGRYGGYGVWEFGLGGENGVWRAAYAVVGRWGRHGHTGYPDSTNSVSHNKRRYKQ